MSSSWIDVFVGQQRHRHELPSGRTSVGGAGCDVVVSEGNGDELHVWSDPPRLIFIGKGPPPLVNGRAVEERELSDGDSIQWGAAVIVFGLSAVIEEIPLEQDAPVPQPVPAAAQGPVSQGASPQAWTRIQAGLMADLGLVDKGVARRWREAVVRSEFDADACARELLAGATVGAEDARVLARSAQLERDLLMSRDLRGLKGAGRKARAKARSGAAFLVANLIAISVYSLVVLAILVLVRVNYGTSFDAAIDWLRSPFGGLE